MGNKETKSRANELKVLSSSVKTNLFTMLKLVHEILGDPEYVESRGGENSLMSQWEADEFSHFGGKPSLSSMLLAYRKNPLESTWKQYRYNVQAMIDLATEGMKEERPQVSRTNWKAKCAELEEELSVTKAMLAETKAELARVNELREQALKYIGELESRLRDDEQDDRKAA